MQQSPSPRNRLEFLTSMTGSSPKWHNDYDRVPQLDSPVFTVSQTKIPKNTQSPLRQQEKA